jgi:hypothetical protein
MTGVGVTGRGEHLPPQTTHPNSARFNPENMADWLRHRTMPIQVSIATT